MINTATGMTSVYATTFIPPRDIAKEYGQPYMIYEGIAAASPFIAAAPNIKMDVRLRIHAKTPKIAIIMPQIHYTCF